MPPTNTAAWLPAAYAKPLKVSPAPYTPPKPGQMVIKNRAVAVNPVDWAKQLFGNLLLPYIKYPFIPGGDVAGEVVEVGEGVQRFCIGDHVVGLAVGGAPGSNDPVEGGFQQYVVLREQLTAAIPEWMPFEDACVLPLCIATAAYGLFHKDFLALDPPAVPATPADASNRAVVITGGASSVGSNAIQLAVSAGYQVYTTASPKNFDYCKDLGATQVFDYHKATLVNDVLASLEGKELHGAFALGDGSVEACVAVLRRHPRTSKKFVTFAGTGLPNGEEMTGLKKVLFIVSRLFAMAKENLTSYWSGVPYKFIDTKDLLEPEGVVARTVFKGFLSQALAAKQFVPAPKPEIVGRGLDEVQQAMNIQSRGVSAKKIVVSL